MSTDYSEWRAKNSEWRAKKIKHEALGRAAVYGDLDTVKKYIADPDLRDWDLNESLRFACATGHTEIVKYIIADYRITEISFVDFILACENGHADVVSTLLDHGSVNLKDFQDSYLNEAIRKGKANVVHRLITHPLWVKPYIRDGCKMDDNSIQIAARLGHYSIVHLFIKYGIGDPSTNNNSLLCGAAYDNNNEIVQLLLNDNRVDASVRGSNIPIEYAAEHRNLSMICALIADPRVQASPMSDKVRSLIIPALNEAAIYRRRHAVHAWYALRTARRARAAARRAAAAAVTSM
jgi:ankyrin repeat protein